MFLSEQRLTSSRLKFPHMPHFLSLSRCPCLVTAPTTKGTGITTGRKTATPAPSGRRASTTQNSRRRSSTSSPRRERSACTCDQTIYRRTDPLTRKSPLDPVLEPAPAHLLKLSRLCYARGSRNWLVWAWIRTGATPVYFLHINHHASSESGVQSGH